MPLPEPVVHPIQVTGPPAERLNLIVPGDGSRSRRAGDQETVRRELLVAVVERV